MCVEVIVCNVSVVFLDTVYVCVCVQCLSQCRSVSVLLTVIVVYNLEILHGCLRDSAVEIEHIRLCICINTTCHTSSTATDQLDIVQQHNTPLTSSVLCSQYCTLHKCKSVTSVSAVPITDLAQNSKASNVPMPLMLSST